MNVFRFFVASLAISILGCSDPPPFPVSAIAPYECCQESATQPAHSPFTFSMTVDGGQSYEVYQALVITATQPSEYDVVLEQYKEGKVRVVSPNDSPEEQLIKKAFNLLDEITQLVKDDVSP